MKLNVMSMSGTAQGSVQTPKHFDEPIRPEIIKRAVESLQSIERQPYGADPDAGMKASAKLSRRRRDYRGSYGKGISRVPRKILSRRGSQMYMVGAVAPGTVGGRRAHPPKASKIWAKKINATERRLAIRSALAATLDKKTVEKRGHHAPKDYPFALANDFEQVKKTKDILKALTALGLSDDLARGKNVTHRSGQGKRRGRRIRVPKTLLLVTGKDCPLTKAAANLPGVDIVAVNGLNAQLLAPGGEPGRLTLYTQAALENMSSLFARRKKKVSERTIARAQKTPVKKKTQKLIKQVKQL